MLNLLVARLLTVALPLSIQDVLVACCLHVDLHVLVACCLHADCVGCKQAFFKLAKTGSIQHALTPAGMQACMRIMC